ncbi:MAG: sugar phosphate isomerase/epimerase [Verrucomicrobiae bacterium]|nr:sugar phosphate isomerase/epimerase [Verrucomicrobiae bacterium]
MTNKPWSTEQCIENYARAGVSGITFWRYSFEGRSPANVGRQAREAGLEVVSVARGGFFPATTAAGLQRAIDENRRAIDETAEVGAPSLVLVCGAVPGQPLQASRQQIQDGIAELLPYASERNVILAIEPLHPMYADDRSAVNTMAQASDICEALNSHPNVSIACDVYHTWWDPDLEREITRAAAFGNFTAFHICDWKTPTTDFLNDRGLMGEGCIDIPSIQQWVADSGFNGHHEVEIFSNRYWSMDQDEYLKSILDSYQKLRGS